MNDGCLFNPIGFSLNGLMKDSYYTIHVTPQASCSYVSFETNITLTDYGDMIKRVLDVFKPNNFIVTLFSSKVRVMLLIMKGKGHVVIWTLYGPSRHIR